MLLSTETVVGFPVYCYFSELSDLRYLYKYGEYVSENEIGAASFLNSLSQEEIDAMAKTYTEGYRIGFIMGRKDITKKKTVNIRYNLGFERMVRAAILNFREIGLEPVIYRHASHAVNKKDHQRIGYTGGVANPQFDYDHRQDSALFLDADFVQRKLRAMQTSYEQYKELAAVHGGPACIDVFGEKPFSPVGKSESLSHSEAQQKLEVELNNESGQIVNRYIKGEERSFCIIAYPLPEIGGNYEEIFREIVKINTLDYEKYQKLQQTIIDTLDKSEWVTIKGRGRTQEMLYFIRQIKADGLVHGHDGFKVYVDSPLANEATTIFAEHNYDCYDEEAIALTQKGINPLSFPGLRVSVTSDDSRAINFDEECKVIISASGMCDAGRIKHHLKHNLWGENNTILFVGYQAVGTLGRTLVEGAKEVKLFGEPVYVAAHICQMPGISGHADVNGLIDWVKAFREKPQKVFVTHGEDTVTEIFARRLKEELGLDTMAPFSGTVYDLTADVCEYEAKGIKIVKASVSPKTAKARRAFEKLLGLGHRLLTVIRKNEGTPNKDLERFSREVQALCDKWDRTDMP